MKIYDVSRPIHNAMTTFPGDPKVYYEQVAKIVDGKGCNLGKIEFGLHTGTHIDTPRHFIADGSNLDTTPLEHFIGKTRVVEVPRENTEITRADLEPFKPQRGERILIKSDNSFRDPDAGFDFNYVNITKEAADYLVECGILTVGVDCQTVGKGHETPACHHSLLGAGICIIEGLRLSEVPAGEYFLSALPMHICGAEGSPVRAVLVSE